MNALEILVRIKRITEDMVKEAFVFKAVREGSIMSLSTDDIVNLYPYNAYDYRVDGKNLDYIIPEDSMALLVDLAKINNWSIDNVRYAEFNDCISISVSEGALSIMCKDNSIRSGERVAYVDKLLMRKYGINMKIQVLGGEQLAPLEKLFENPTSIVVESLLSLPLYFVMDPTHVGIDTVADAYIYVLSKGVNRVPTNMDIAEYLIIRNRLSDNYIRVYVLRRELELLKDYFDVRVNESDGFVEYIINEERALKVSTVQGSVAPEILRVFWIDLDVFKINGIGVNLVDLGSTNILDCSDILIGRIRDEFRGIL